MNDFLVYFLFQETEIDILATVQNLLRQCVQPSSFLRPLNKLFSVMHNKLPRQALTNVFQVQQITKQNKSFIDTLVVTPSWHVAISMWFSTDDQKYFITYYVMKRTGIGDDWIVADIDPVCQYKAQIWLDILKFCFLSLIKIQLNKLASIAFFNKSISLLMCLCCSSFRLCQTWSPH